MKGFGIEQVHDRTRDSEQVPLLVEAGVAHLVWSASKAWVQADPSGARVLPAPSPVGENTDGIVS